MNLSKIIQWAKLKSNVTFLKEQDGQRAVYFNIVENMNTKTDSGHSSVEQPEGEVQRVMANIPRVVGMGAWLCSNTLSIIEYLTNVVLSTGKFDIEFEPTLRKSILEEWKEEKTRLTLYGINEKSTDMVIISIVENKDKKYSLINNINLKIGLSEIKKEAKKKEKLDATIRNDGSINVFKTITNALSISATATATATYTISYSGDRHLDTKSTYTISHNGVKYYLDLFSKEDHMIYRVRSKGEFFRGGICRVDINIFYWVNGLTFIPKLIEKNKLEAEGNFG